ncbi:helix-turn-helix transcriptional regulator [Actinospica durhamensis]|uniref:Helix-turn-helix transcriptional regulator n=1 Tax=Actinospica durhamensis TaxID=1508375 RepID=A0A941EST2_9ACTN|nr:helix-turn-helix transcriptional regulator [Actinospica durhamensis]MBR7835807.1 helix-turn-helix transcriptional regulator [Actinospica durhamensis]
MSERSQVRKSATSDEPSSALQELVRERVERQGWSYGEVARRGGLPRSTVHHLATVERLARMPQPATLEGLARGLELPLDTIRRAAATTCGIHLYDASPDPEVDLLMASLQQLSADDRRHVTALVESLLERNRGAATTTGDAHGNGAAGSTGSNPKP